MKRDRIVTILSNVEVAKDIYELKLQVVDFPCDIRGGQFIHIALPSEVHLLRRPFCIADFDKKETYCKFGSAVGIAGSTATPIPPPTIATFFTFLSK